MQVVTCFQREGPNDIPPIYLCHRSIYRTKRLTGFGDIDARPVTLLAASRSTPRSTPSALRPTLYPVIPLLTVVFVVSGAAGLIYESIWSRYLSLLVGHSAYAQIIVLVIFLGGMSLGASIVGRRSSALRTPLLWYAGVELLVGILALVFHDAFVAVTARAYES